MMNSLARGEALSPQLAEAIDRYWNAKNYDEQRRAYFDALAQGQPPSYGENWATAELINIEWAQFWSDSPTFAIPLDIRRWTWPWPMLVEFGDG